MDPVICFGQNTVCWWKSCGPFPLALDTWMEAIYPQGDPLQGLEEDHVCRDCPPQSTGFLHKGFGATQSTSWVFPSWRRLFHAPAWSEVSTRCAGCEASRKVQDPGTPDMSYNMIFRWLLLVLDLEAPGKTKLWTMISCHLCWAWGHLGRGMVYAETICLNFWEILEKSQA